jgi:predicted nuclease of predicted toxin-antitoxin system
MRILANENVAGETVAALRQLGHDVAWIAADAAGASDRQVLQRAADEDRIIVTFDKDFGELAFRERLPVSTGVILLRVQAKDPTTLTQIVAAALESRDDWTGHFSVVENQRLRMTPLPKTAD